MLPLAMAPVALNGIPFRVMGRSLMTSSFTCEEVNDRVLVLIQLHGGNDGLNTMIPVDQYAVYKNLRPLIGLNDFGPRRYIDLDTTLPIQDQVGLHPDLVGIKDLYDSGKVHIVQDVSYPQNNGSHFKGTDIWLSGKEGGTMPENPDSGWWGRYLDHKFQNFPTAYPNPDMEDPPGIEFGSHIISLGFHRQTGIPMGLTLSNDPSNFNTLVTGVGGALPDQFPTSDYGNELRYLVEMEMSTNQYAQRITDIYNAGTNSPSVTYPINYHSPSDGPRQNRLSPQLRTVARLLSGGSKTKIFLVRMGGFDTHGEQALAGKPSYGNHGALLYHLSGALKAFQDDLADQGLDDRVVTVTFSEFGRQVGENSTLGTDHGTSAPMFVIGKGVKPGISGTNPNLSVLKNNNFTSYQHDYRQIFATVLQDWFGANNGSLDHAEFYEFSNQKLGLIDENHIDDIGNSVNYVADTECDPTDDLPDIPPLAADQALQDFVNVQAYPNPVVDQLTVSLIAPRLMPAAVVIYTMNGKRVMNQNWNLYSGDNKTRLDLGQLSAGHYLLQVVSNPGSAFGQKVLGTRKIVK